MRPARDIVLACLAALSIGTPAARAQDVVLRPDEAQVLSERALETGRPDLAAALAAGLLRRDAADPAALIVLSASESMLGAPESGAKRARRAFRLSGSPEQRFLAARMAAYGLYRAGRFTAAEWWLRRAGQVAPDDAARSIAVRDFALVRAENPLRFRFDLSVAPSSNVNNGSTAEIIDLFGLPFRLDPAARPLSGTEVVADLTARYRLARSPEGRTWIHARLYSRSVDLSEEAERQAPDADAEDFAVRLGEVGVTRRLPLARGVAALAGAAGLRQDGDDGTFPFGRLSASLQWPLEAGRMADAGVWLDHFSTENGPVSVANLEIGLSEPVAIGRIRIGLGLDRALSDDATRDFEGVRAEIDLGEINAPLDVLLGAGFEARWRNYGDDAFPGVDREDTTFSARLDAVFGAAEYYGFAPSLGVEWRSTDSTADFYDTEEVGVTLGIRSTF